MAFLSSVTCLMWMWSLGPMASGHPQCANADPPFAPSGNLTLCPEYSQFGCCSLHAENELLELYQHVQHRLKAEDWQRCQDYTRELLCQRCSPVSAHLFDTEIAEATARKLPGLCPNYCSHFYTTCRDIVWFIDEDLATSVTFQSKEMFCEHAQISDMDYCFPDFAESQKSGEASSGHQHTHTEAVCLCLEPVMTGLAGPLFGRHAGDGTGRMFVAEQQGLIYIVHPTTKTRLPKPFLDITEKILLSFNFGDERGLIGLAFHPDFAHNGRFFVHYNAPLESQAELTEKERGFGVIFQHVTRVSEMHVSATDANMADHTTERILLQVNKPYANHNGGELFFRDDGYLYIFLGDGGKAGDPHNQAQDLTSLLGKVLRLDVDKPPSGNLSYAIPSDNPFVDQAGVRPEIYAYGVRNIWRCGVDPGDKITGAGRDRVLCGDVGQSLYEEVDLLKKGANYGWRAWEGDHCYDRDMCQQLDPTKVEMPVYVYDHTVGKSVTGGQFYRGCRYPSLDGKYIYGDYMVGKLFSLEETSNGTWVNKDISMCDDDRCNNGLTNRVDTYITSFGLDQDGEVYVLSSPSGKTNVPDGGLYRIVDPVSTKGKCQ